MENPGVLGNDSYSTFVSPGMQFSNLTGLRRLKDGSMGDGDQLIQYIDLNSPIQDGPYAGFNYKFALLDKRGNLLRDNIGRDELEKIVGGTSAGDLLTYKKVSDRSAGKYYNKYYEDIVGKDEQNAGIRIYRDIKNPNSDVILHLDGLRGAAKGKDIALPKEIAEILMQDQSWVDKIVESSQARENFEKALSSLVQDRTGRRIREVLGATGIMGPYDLIFNGFGGDKDYRMSRLRELGLSKEQTAALQQALINASKGNKSDRRGDYLLETPEFRNGGKVQYISKLAGGGFAGGSKTSQGVTERTVNKTVHNPKNASSLAEIGSDNWTDADTKDLLALVGDATSLGLAFVPGANLASTVTGVAGSLEH